METAQNRNLWWTLVVVAVICVCAVAFYRGIGLMISTERQLAQVLAINDKLDSDNRALLRQAQRLRVDQAAVERAARREMDVVRPDEVVYQGKDAEVKPALAVKE
ncbi:Septum formation initiator [Desulfarculus baarsii DSM 2075]|uniref:Septum formation initiator n=1 Tax=Desulfarculus baarsii (strain ATCC 33931 / DSM 2075 / LMG 7858 / VKM B-1802 / 2st14) TaxID=644282 RepID=E1QJ29_DESB2|nr:septum formation initiator family protein [Desulfarculus baarsii]ADK85572.1 Septum formation initiator [Desulfarculus baarsii DSM 2075]